MDTNIVELATQIQAVKDGIAAAARIIGGIGGGTIAILAAWLWKNRAKFLNSELEKKIDASVLNVEQDVKTITDAPPEPKP